MCPGWPQNKTAPAVARLQGAALHRKRIGAPHNALPDSPGASGAVRSNARSLPIRLRFRRGSEHLHRLGAYALSHFLLESAQHRDDIPAMLDRLDYWRASLSPELLHAIGGDRFPTELQLVPDDLNEEIEEECGA